MHAWRVVVPMQLGHHANVILFIQMDHHRPIAPDRGGDDAKNQKFCIAWGAQRAGFGKAFSSIERLEMMRIRPRR